MQAEDRSAMYEALMQLSSNYKYCHSSLHVGHYASMEDLRVSLFRGGMNIFGNRHKMADQKG